MFLNEDTTYNDIRERSLLQWLDEKIGRAHV